MKKRKRKKFDRMVRQAIRHPDNFSVMDIARLLVIKREHADMEARQKEVAVQLRKILGVGDKAMGFRCDEDE